MKTNWKIQKFNAIQLQIIIQKNESMSSSESNQQQRQPSLRQSSFQGTNNLKRLINKRFNENQKQIIRVFTKLKVQQENQKRSLRLQTQQKINILQTQIQKHQIQIKRMQRIIQDQKSKNILENNSLSTIYRAQRNCIIMQNPNIFPEFSELLVENDQPTLMKKQIHHEVKQQTKWRISTQVRLKVQNMLKQKISIYKIANQLKLSRPTVRKIFNLMNSQSKKDD